MAPRLAGLLPALALLGALAALQGAAAQGGAEWLMTGGLSGPNGGPSILDGFEPNTLPCLSDPQEYAKAFKERSARCTTGLNVRLGPVPGGSVPNWWEKAVRTGKKVPTPWSEAEKRVREGLFQKFANFFGIGDQPMKYLAMGNPTAPRGTITTIPNGLAFLEQIGYQMADADVTQVGVLMVIRDPATLTVKGKFRKGYFGPYTANGTTMNLKSGKSLPKNNKKWDGLAQPWPKSFPPTFDSLMTYLSTYLKSANITSLKAEDVKATTTELSASSFQQLTGCPGICVFEDLAFPDPTGSTYYPPANTPVRTMQYKADGTCALDDYPYTTGAITAATAPDPFSNASPKPLVPRFRRLNADAADFWSPTCTDSAFKRYRDYVGTRPCPGFTDFNGNLDIYGLLTQFATFWNEAGANAKTRATLVRTFLTLSCMGSFNPLFSGNGATYTGTGGFYAPLGQEQILEQLTPNKPSVPVTNGTGTITLPACNTTTAKGCWAGLPYIAGPCVDAALQPTGEGLLCDYKNGLGATFMPICFNGNSPNTDPTTYVNNDPNYACLPNGKKCVNGAFCCSPHCSAMRPVPHAYDPNCATNSTMIGCDIGNCRTCRFKSDTTADPALLICPKCLCIDWRKPFSECDETGF